jgi:hypothetical protein
VDDCRITGPNIQDLEWTIEQISKKFEIKHVSEDKPYLGMELTRLPNGDLFISQKRYIQQILEDFGMDNCRPSPYPMNAGLKLEFSPDEEGHLDNEFSPTNYRMGTGDLQFLASQTQPDIAYAVNYLSRFNSRPNKACWQALKHILRYLKGTAEHGILYRTSPDGTLDLVAYSDSDWAGADPSYKSTSGYILFVNGSPVRWRAMKQTSVSKSTTEAEYISASETACDLVWLADLLRDAGLIDETPTTVQTSKIEVDNKGAIDLSRAENLTRRARHIEIRYHLLRD